ncbi:M28 family peptidase [Spirosoma utsteinense]|uniref:N-acetylated-alpha-linked acidic dipeptidase n=1 Tax=Spirosoma utsteinense TaxID=2585773 RepID=A0ABR6W2W0_9BACT|nr:M28 family peptidase [Spirosoma utsteinense]MBC3785226.1 N-acetylated-alpha-linked acidic dipeptidase [Spirosoma utsteinense]MBC3790549.1 N-acetylated-alpha-linked acidic dipeptidase [Spirosoma utsteinense]
MKNHSLLRTAFGLFVGLTTAQAQTSPAPTLTGFIPARQAAQTKLETEFKTKQSSAAFKNHLERLSSVPHITGSKENEQVRDYIAETMRKAGWQVDIYPHDVLLPKGPGEIAVEVVEPVRQPLNIKEFMYKEDKYASDPRLTPGYNAWSGSGDVTAEVVYANYGRKEDFEQLKAMGISVKGKIVMARYGGNFRGYKAQFAQAAGAAGVIIYTDPSDAGYVRGLTFPEGPFYSESTIQRGSLLTVPYTGDPLTPGEAAIPMDAKGTPKRLDQKDVALHKIPVTPLPYGSATEILKRMTGMRSVPAGWQGGLPYTYRLEGGPALKVRLMVKQELAIQRIYQVVGTLTGSEFPDEWIIAGCHYDAWSYGATDPNSGTAMLLSMTESLGKLAKAGQRPRRTIKVAHWDAEEPGVIGSAEWSEQFRDELTQKAVAYMNYDAAVSGRTFGASASPSMKRLIIEATQAVQYPDSNKTVYQHWMSHTAGGNPTRVTGSSAPALVQGEPTIGNLGGGSDHIAPYMHIGIPALSAGMEGPTLYHSQYDDLYFYDKFADPTYKMGPMMEQVVGTMTLRLANADLVPYDVARYPTDLAIHLKAAEKAIQSYAPTYSIKPLLDAVAEMKTNADACETARQTYLKMGRTDKLVALNRELRLLERSFIDPKGNAFGAWYRSLYASSDPNSGYASWMLPGLLYEASLKSTANLPDLEARYKKAITTLSEKMRDLSQGMEAPAAVGGGNK